MARALSEVKKYVGLPRDLADKVEEEAKQRKMPDSVVIREALVDRYYPKKEG